MGRAPVQADDPTLLAHLNRDEVWLTEKTDRGTTALTALAEYGETRCGDRSTWRGPTCKGVLALYPSTVGLRCAERWVRSRTTHDGR
jgi:hypothetical protein